MPKKRATGRNKSSVRTTSKRAGLISVLITLSLIAAGGALAQWTGIVSLSQKKSKSGGEVSIQSLSPDSPSKEYIY